MVNINGIRRVALLTLLILVIILFCLDRYAAYKHRPVGDSNAVVIYTTKRCPYCVKLRADLKANRITHKEYDVENSLDGFLGMWTLRTRGVPVSVIGPNVVYGYRVDELVQAFDELGLQFIPQPLNP
jgi:mycoredoxin